MKTVLLLLLGSGLPFGVAAQQGDTLTAQAAIQTVLAQYEAAWNRHDAPGLAAQYQVNATWVNWFGAYSKGQAAIRAHYATVHGSYFKTSHFTTRAVEDISFLKPDVALVHVRTALTGDTRYPGQTFEFRRTLVFTQRAGAWRIIAGQNAKLEAGVK